MCPSIPNECRNSSSASRWTGGLFPLWISFLIAPVTLRTSSDATKVDAVRAIQHWRNSFEIRMRVGEERSLPPAVVYLHCHPLRSSVASFHRTLTCVGDSVVSSTWDSPEPEPMSRVPLQAGYLRQPQK